MIRLAGRTAIPTQNNGSRIDRREINVDVRSFRLFAMIEEQSKHIKDMMMMMMFICLDKLFMGNQLITLVVVVVVVVRRSMMLIFGSRAEKGNV